MNLKFPIAKGGGARDTLSEAECITEILGDKNQEIRGGTKFNVLMFMYKMLRNSPTGIFNSKIFVWGDTR